METLRLIQFRAAYNLPIHAAVEQGIFARHGLALEIAYTPGSAFVCRALKDGGADIGFTAADDIIADVEADRRSDLFMFMGLHGGLFTLVSAPNVNTVEALANSTIGVDAKNTGFVLVLEKFLNDRGLPRGRYDLIEIGGWERRYTALSEGKISATLLTEPFLSNALAAGCHLLARDLEMIPAYQGTVGAASRAWAERHRDLLLRFMRGYVEATQWCFERAHHEACLAILGRHSGVTGSAADKTLEALLHPQRGLYPKAELNIAGVRAAMALRAELGYLSQPIPRAKKYCDLSYYQEALSKVDASD
ncbi:MAG: ABC transporter substrate-binding protein [Deltaproteobacteria bacterium]|nr:ABC transporter substrate-binding protein [Deltaproteobacteria bacterium]